MIESNINKAKEGSGIAEASAQAMDKIVEEMTGFTTVMDDIYNSSIEQANAIDSIAVAVDETKEETIKNVKSSDESFAANEKLTENAKLLKKSMDKFNLRQRQKDKAYIPPAKANDDDFIREANENYNRYIKTGAKKYEN